MSIQNFSLALLLMWGLGSVFGIVSMYKSKEHWLWNESASPKPVPLINVLSSFLNELAKIFLGSIFGALWIGAVIYILLGSLISLFMCLVMGDGTASIIMGRIDVEMTLLLVSVSIGSALGTVGIINEPDY